MTIPQKCRLIYPFRAIAALDQRERDREELSKARKEKMSKIMKTVGKQIGESLQKKAAEDEARMLKVIKARTARFRSTLISQKFWLRRLQPVATKS